MFYNTVTEEIINYVSLKDLFPQGFSWPKIDNGESVDARLLMSQIHPDITNWKRLYISEKPVVGRYEVAEKMAPVYQNDRWEQDWEVRPMTQQETDAVDDGVKEEIKEYRDVYWQGVAITLSNGAELTNDEQTQARFVRTLELLKAMGDPELTVRWKCNNGHYDLTPALFQEGIVQGGIATQKAFLAEEYILDNHAQNPYLDDSWQGDFDTFMEAT